MRHYGAGDRARPLIFRSQAVRHITIHGPCLFSEQKAMYERAALEKPLTPEAE